MRFTRWFYTVPLRLRSLFRRSQVEQELDEELRYHLERQIEELIAKGMTPEEARYAALRALGGIEQRKEECRDMRRVRLIEDLIQDLSYGLQMFRKNPGFALIAVLTLSLGIGANTAIFSVVNVSLLRSLPYQDPDRLVRLSYYRPDGFSGGASDVGHMDYLDWRNQAKAFEKIATFSAGTADLTGSGEPERLALGNVSADLFETLGVAPALGRAFTREEYTVGGAPVVILSHSLWQRRFGGDPQVIGRAITLEREGRTIVGIMPPRFRFPEESELWIPNQYDPNQQFSPQELRREEGEGGKSVIARLKPGVTLEAARADLSRILEWQRQAFPANYADVRVRVIGLIESLLGNVRLALLVLFGAVSFVLLIACANVSNLLLARSAARRKEMAIRAAIGASRWRLVRQLLTESLLLSVVGGIAGLLAAMWGVKLLIAMSPVEIARMAGNDPSFLVDGRVLGFTCMLAALVGLVAGAFPALAASKVDVNEALKAHSTTWGVQMGRGGLRRMLPALMIVELALALVLLVGAGLMIKSFLRLQAVPRGFNPEGVLTLNLNFRPDKNYSPGGLRRAYYQEALERIQALPGVQTASLSDFLPLGIGKPAIILDRGPERGEDRIVTWSHISPNYFQTIGMQLRAGRAFTAQDGAEAPKVAIINEKLARVIFPGEDPIGQRVGLLPPQG